MSIQTVKPRYLQQQLFKPVSQLPENVNEAVDASLNVSLVIKGFNSPV